MRHFIITVFVLSISQSLHSKESTYSCDFLWNTNSEKINIEKRLVQKSRTELITNGMKATIEITGESSNFEIKEFYKNNPENYSAYNFSCDKYLNCNGSHQKNIDGNLKTEIIDIKTSSTIGIGKLGQREVFQYQNTGEGFKYFYSIYRNEKNEPMGLSISCKAVL